ncbi:hydrophobic protein [Streptomyces carpaticus]|uniref:Hydrophobic protein n=1 Tax=Streptomyces carpaticus TaxID=285558 RepID=A0ABV4ZG35_9ACTN
MVPMLLVLLLALVLFGVGFAAEVLWWIAALVLLIWLLGFIVRPLTGEGRRTTWYRW